MNVVEMQGMAGGREVVSERRAVAAGAGMSPARLAALRRHIQALLDAGVPLAGIAWHCGLNRKTIQWVASGRAEAGVPPGYRLEPVHAERILALVALPLHGGADNGQPVPAVGTVRRLRALMAAGHPAADLAGHLHVAAQTVTAITDSNPDTVPASLARSAAALFLRLEMTTGGCQESRRRANRRQWAPPLAWDADQIDTPEAKPDFGAQARRPGFLATYSELRAWGFTDVRIAEHMGVQASSLLRQMNRYDLPASDELTAAASEEKRRARRAAS